MFSAGMAIPANVWNRDSWAGGITEGSDSGADIEHLRHHANHSSIATTGRYNRKPSRGPGKLPSFVSPIAAARTTEERGVRNAVGTPSPVTFSET